MSRSQFLWHVRLRRVALARLLRRADLDTQMSHTEALLREWSL